MKLFDNGRFIQCRLERRAAAGSCGPFLGRIYEIAPTIFTRSRSSEKHIGSRAVVAYYRSTHIAAYPHSSLEITEAHDASLAAVSRRIYKAFIIRCYPKNARLLQPASGTKQPYETLVPGYGASGAIDDGGHQI